MNVVSNAVKFSPDDGKVSVRISSTKHLRQGHDDDDDGYDSSFIKTLLSVTVIDKGPGIAEDDIALLFQPFVTLPKTKHLNPHGVGLGLFVCKVILDKHGGDIHCYSNGYCGT